MVWSVDQLTQGDSYVTATFKQLYFRDKLTMSLLLTVKTLRLNKLSFRKYPTFYIIWVTIVFRTLALCLIFIH